MAKARRKLKKKSKFLRAMKPVRNAIVYPDQFIKKEYTHIDLSAADHKGYKRGIDDAVKAFDHRQKDVRFKLVEDVSKLVNAIATIVGELGAIR